MKPVIDYETTNRRLSQALDYLTQNTNIEVAHQVVCPQKPLSTNTYKLTAGQHDLGCYAAKDIYRLTAEIQNWLEARR